MAGHYWPKRAHVEDAIAGGNYIIEKELQPQVYSKLIEAAVVELFFNLKSSNNEKVYRVFKNNHHLLWPNGTTNDKKMPFV